MFEIQIYLVEDVILPCFVRQQILLVTTVVIETWAQPASLLITVCSNSSLLYYSKTLKANFADFSQQ